MPKKESQIMDELSSELRLSNLKHFTSKPGRMIRKEMLIRMNIIS